MYEAFLKWLSRILVLIFLLVILRECVLIGGPKEVVLDAPPDGFEFGTKYTRYMTIPSVTFRWHFVEPKKGATYRSWLIIDKGSNPFDGGYEYMLDAGDKTELGVSLDFDAHYEWGVVVKQVGIGSRPSFKSTKSRVSSLYIAPYPGN